MDISIIICTCNRCESLLKTLQSIAGMYSPDSIRWEVIVVDNHSNDNTKKVVNEFSLTSKVDITYVVENKRGLSNARNRGVEESKGEIVAFTDDDCIVDVNWLNCLMNEFSSDSAVSGIGGRVELYDERDKPITIMTSKERDLFSSVEQLFSFMHGCNMAFSRKCLDKVGKFDCRLGAGTKISSAEDTDIIYRVHKNDCKLIYCPDVVVYHNHGRRLDSEVGKLMNGYASGRGAFYLKNILKGDVMITKIAYWEILALLRTIMDSSKSSELKNKSSGYLQNIIKGACYYLFL